MAGIQTLAFKIDEDTWSLAVALLPPQFAALSRSEVYGNYVVMNDLDVGSAPPPPPGGGYVIHSYAVGSRPRRDDSIVYNNIWLTKADLKELFDFEGKLSEQQTFFEVTRK